MYLRVCVCVRVQRTLTSLRVSACRKLGLSMARSAVYVSIQVVT